ncbi:MAG: C25 family cysteine peptidase, partial [Candidatus Syntrophosphaera sp.]
VSCLDPYVTLITSDRIEYDDLHPGETGLNINPIVLQIDDLCPDQYQIALNLDVESTGGNWPLMVPLTVSNGYLELVSQNFVGAPGNVMYPGDQYPLTISMINSGSMDLAGISGVLRSNDMFFTVPDSLSYYGDIPQNSTVTNDTDTFTVFARSTCIDGMVIPLSLELYNSNGFSQTLYMTVTIGQTTVSDPLGQDAYGYFIYDEGDTAYDLCPAYDWIGIAPAEGGSGTALNLVDPGSSDDEGDQPNAVAIQTVNLPFTFKYYGVDYNQASISSNGFIAFGETIDADWRNWRLPDAGGPSPMVAVFWDDLDLVSGTSNVYTYYDPVMHYFVVEWYN